jgi:hypothetical protein
MIIARAILPLIQTDAGFRWIHKSFYWVTLPLF